MSESFARSLVLAIERSGIDPRPLLRSSRWLALPHAGPPLRDVLETLDGLAKARGDTAIGRVGEAWASTVPALTRLAGRMLAPAWHYRGAIEIVRRSLPIPTGARRQGNLFEFWARLPDDSPACEPLLRALGPLFSALASTIACPPARVEVVELADRSVRLRIHPPRLRPFAPRLTDAQSAALIDTVLSELDDDANGPRIPAVPSLVSLEREFELTPAEGRVVRRLALGMSIGDIAKDFKNSAETVRTHVKRAMQKTQTHRQAELVALVLRH